MPSLCPLEESVLPIVFMLAEIYLQTPTTFPLVNSYDLTVSSMVGETPNSVPVHRVVAMKAESTLPVPHIPHLFSFLLSRVMMPDFIVGAVGTTFGSAARHLLAVWLFSDVPQIMHFGVPNALR